MNNAKEKPNMSIMKIMLITFISIMLVTSILISIILFTNWLSYADGALTDIVTELQNEIYIRVQYHVENHMTHTDEIDSLDEHLRRVVDEKSSMALVVDRETGDLIANSINMDNDLRLQNGTRRPVRVTNMGYPALNEAYYSYLDSKGTLFKLKNIQKRLYINISDFKTEEFDWLIFTVVEDSRLTPTILRNINYTIILVAVAITISLISYFTITKKLLKPAKYLLDLTEKFASGDLSQRAVIVRNDEVGMITRAFNSMADTIYELVNNLEGKVKERTLELEKANEVIKDNRNQLRLILDSTAEAIYGMDMEGNCTFCNASCIEILGYESQEELVGKNMHYQIHHSKRDYTKMPIEECRIIQAVENGTRFHADDEVFWRRDGTYFDVEYNVYPQLKDGVVLGAVVTFMDITETKRTQKQMEYLSSHDPVTGLYNRMFFENEFKRIDVNKNLPISIIYGDVNGLKLVNDIYGHEKGDELLIRTAEVLTKVCREDDIVARIGGDEFIILLTNTEADNANKIIQRIKSEFSAQKIVGIKGSIALASDTKTEPEDDIEIVLKKAEAQMYKLKTLERRSVNSGMLKDIMESLYEKSPREKSHSINVARICKEIAIKMNLPGTDARKVADAGYYHDIGKIVLDTNILNKHGKFKGEEKEEMKRHPLIGYRILNLFDETMNIAEIVLAHHERWNGTGYPKGLKGEEIPLFARIVSVAKGYDSLTNRVDGSGLTHEEAIEEIKSQSGLKFDPSVVEIFMEIDSMK
ncbi:MAG: diguanylate cyclase [Tissierella sp.]|nr:diguanylate cyclase [Tissierella sp.]